MKAFMLCSVRWILGPLLCIVRFSDYFVVANYAGTNQCK